MDSSLYKLKSQIKGFVIESNNASFAKLTAIDNGRIKRRPKAIVQVKNTTDIQKVIECARNANLKITAKGGGHSAAGYCLNDGGIVIDLSEMKEMSLVSQTGDKAILKVQMGALWLDVYQFLLKEVNGFFPIGGGCPTVGIPGFMLGGGYSFVSRRYGMSIDNLVSLTLVTADGNIRQLNDQCQSTDDQRLFWACRGGGGGNFGIASEMEIVVHKPKFDKLFISQIRFAPEKIEEVLDYYNDWVEWLPEEMAAYGIWKDGAFGFTIVYDGDPQRGEVLIKPLLDYGATSCKNEMLSLAEFELANGKTTLVQGRQAYIRSGIVPPGKMSAGAGRIIKKHMEKAPSKDSFIVWTHAGGQIEKTPNDQTAFFHRNARFVPEVKAIWQKPEDTRANVEWAYQFFEELGQERFSGAYVNYIDPLLTNWKTMYYGEHYERLERIKKDFDPGTLFSFPQAIGSGFEPSSTLPLDLSPLS